MHCCKYQELPLIWKMSWALSASEMVWYGAMRAIHCYWSILKSSLNTHSNMKMSVKLSTSLFGVMLSHISIRLHCCKIMNIPAFWDNDQPSKWGDGEQGGLNIASEVLQWLSFVSIIGRASIWGGKLTLTAHNSIYIIGTTKNCLWYGRFHVLTLH